MSKKLHIEKNTVQETLVIPLYARKKCTELFPTLYQDETAARLIEGIDYDFSANEAKANSSCSASGFSRSLCVRTTLPGRCVITCASTPELPW